MTNFFQCPSCKGIGRLAVTYGRDIATVDSCDECNGRGVRLCCETRCAEPAVSELLERGESYPLCFVHLVQWLEDMNV